MSAIDGVYLYAAPMPPEQVTPGKITMEGLWKVNHSQSQSEDAYRSAFKRVLQELLRLVTAEGISQERKEALKEVIVLLTNEQP